jgi:hypothetical protein
MRPLQIGVMGSMTASPDKQRLHDLAESVGRRIADQEGVHVFGAEGRKWEITHERSNR